MLNIKTRTWTPSRFEELGRGGEAVVYKIRDDTAAKVFHLPNALEYADNPQMQEAARARITEMQTKLLQFPEGLTSDVAAPNGVLVNGKGQIFGYVMPFIDGMSLDRFGRTTSILTASLTMKLLSGLHDLVSGLHAKGIVIGDLNENNIIVSKRKPRLIDADSVQFGPYECRSFMPRFVAPELISFDEDGREPQPTFKMVAPHSPLTDWYSFTVIAMRLITFTDPYGGVTNGIELGERITKRMTVFDPKVMYPRIAKPLKCVPRPILDTFFRMFHKGERFIPDKEVFRSLCPNCKN